MRGPVASDLSTLSVTEDGTPKLIGALLRHSLRIERGAGTTARAGGSGWVDGSFHHEPMKAVLKAEGHIVEGAGQSALRRLHIAGAQAPFAIHHADGGTWQGRFSVRSLTLEGKAEEELRFAVELHSTGPLTHSEQGAQS
jgi:predicted secreted protein